VEPPMDAQTPDQETRLPQSNLAFNIFALMEDDTKESEPQTEVDKKRSPFTQSDGAKILEDMFFRMDFRDMFPVGKSIWKGASKRSKVWECALHDMSCASDIQ
ncbi:hypothetical protein KIPB_015058, partial [Kipferlia bialata]